MPIGFFELCQYLFVLQYNFVLTLDISISCALIADGFFQSAFHRLGARSFSISNDSPFAWQIFICSSMKFL
jgi:hypothetical protein